MFHVLVVEDLYTNLQVFSLLAEKLGFECFTSGDGNEAMAMLEELNFKCDLIFLDLQMPGMNAFEIAKKIREREQSVSQSLRSNIIGMSAAPVSQKRIAESGMDGILEKPVAQDSLSGFIEQLLPKIAPREKGKDPETKQKREKRKRQDSQVKRYFYKLVAFPYLFTILVLLTIALSVLLRP